LQGIADHAIAGHADSGTGFGFGGGYELRREVRDADQAGHRRSAGTWDNAGGTDAFRGC